MAFEVHLSSAAGDSVEWVESADSYQQEGPMTTFFGNDAGRSALDAWCTKVASYRTERILSIRRRAGSPGMNNDGVEWGGPELRAV